MIKTSVAVFAAAGIALMAGQAAAQACAPDGTNACTVRYANDPDAWIARLIPRVGGKVVCDGIPADTVQYDSYSWLGGYHYQCSSTVPCSQVDGNDQQAYDKFCK